MSTFCLLNHFFFLCCCFCQSSLATLWITGQCLHLVAAASSCRIFPLFFQISFRQQVLALVHRRLPNALYRKRSCLVMESFFFFFNAVCWRLARGMSEILERLTWTPRVDSKKQLWPFFLLLVSGWCKATWLTVPDKHIDEQFIRMSLEMHSIVSLE